MASLSRTRSLGAVMALCALMTLGCVMVVLAHTPWRGSHQGSRHWLLKYGIIAPVIVLMLGLSQVVSGLELGTLYRRWTDIPNPVIKYLWITPFLIIITIAVIILIAVSLPTPPLDDLRQGMQKR